ncbi:hypothetical protein PHLCEN_2v11763 [Hermanssonia centrifuga]|uniref:Uncharacterized protein n=1 Tax=Hermanssonia centrifuga TaxID=98765 RepID=A0A2R6NIZ7_9APHY|nr:hypothetical protein PHLCEN_2v11763 [Hermanssonia centrifuga]
MPHVGCRLEAELHNDHDVGARKFAVCREEVKLVRVDINDFNRSLVFDLDEDPGHDLFT